MRDKHVQTKPNQTKPNQTTKAFLVLVILAFTLGFFTPVLADYLGPDRTVTTASEVCKMVLYECMYVAAKGDYRYHRVEDWSCSNESKPWQAYENSTVACEPWNVGRTYYDKDYSVVTTTITHPEATITGVLQNCTLQNGWCVTSPQLELTANEPLAGHQIILIEGAYNGEIFACPELQTTCQLPLNEGQNNFEYWALSSWGDSSRKSTMNIKVDTVAPNLNLLVNGTLGQNNWYVSNTTITAEGADGTSGVYEKVLSIDNGTTWIPSTILTDGVYQVDIKVTDNAYNISTASATLQVDTVTPTLSLSISGAKGNSNYYISKPKITASASDATSGVAKIEMTADGGAWTIITAPVEFSDGVHTYQFRVYDNAGNMTETPVQSIQVDTVPPTVEADEEITLGETLYYTLHDNGSGLSISRIVIEDEDEKYKKIVWAENLTGNKIEGDILWDGKFANKTLASVGEYFITFKISDRAGNETFYTTVVNVNPLSYFQSIPEFTPPESVETSNESTSNEQVPEQSFGGTTAQTGNLSTTHKLEFGSSTTVSTNTTTNTTSNILWGTAAAALIGMATAYALDQQKRREEAEAAQIAQVTAEVEAKNAAIEANRIAMIEQLKIRNWLAGKNTLDAWIKALEAQGVSKEEIDKLKENASAKGFGAAIAKAQGLFGFIQQTQYQQDREDAEEEQTMLNQLALHETKNTNPFAGVSAGGGVGSSGGGSKPLAKPLPQDPNPPEEHNDGVSSWWDVFDLDWWSSDEPWPWPFGPALPQQDTSSNVTATQTSAIQTAWAQITQTAQAILTPTPAVQPFQTPTPLVNYQIYKSFGPLTNWELTVGGQVAHNAHLLLAQANNFYFWTNDDPGTNSYPPKPLNYNPNFPISLNPNDYNYNTPWGNVFQYTGGKIPFVCGDVPDLAYFMAGYNLQQLIPQPNYPNHWPSASYTYMTVLFDQGNLNIHSVDTPNFANVPELGDVLVIQTSNHWGDNSGAGHVVVVAEVHGNTPSQVIVIDGNAAHGTLEQYTVQELIDREPNLQYLLYGHPDLPTGTP